MIRVMERKMFNVKNYGFLIVILVGVIGLVILFTFDPTHSYPRTKMMVEILPGSNVTINVPRVGAIQWVVELFADPWFWVDSDVDDLKVIAKNKILDVRIDTIVGIWSKMGNGDEVMVYNPTNMTIRSLIHIVRAPPADKLGNLKTIWMAVVSSWPILVGLLLSYLKPSPKVNIRNPVDARASSIFGKGMDIKKGKCQRCRCCFVWTTRKCCLCSLC